MVELHCTWVGDSGGLGKRLDGVIRVLEERNRVLRPQLEEVMTEVTRRREVGDQPGTEHPVIEADRRIHVVGDQREVVDSPPAGGLFV